MATSPEDLLNWDDPGAPARFRQAYDEQQRLLKELQERDKANSERIAAIDRRDRFEALKKEGGDALKDVTLEDLADMPAEQLNPTILQAKALEKQAARLAAETQMAKDMGFDSVEDLRSFRADAEARKASERQAMGAQAAVATAGAGMPEPPKTPSEEAFAAYRERKGGGAPEDEARAEYIGAYIQGQLRQAVEAAPTP